MEIIAELKKILDPQRVLNDPESLVQFGQDWTRYYKPNPVAIAFPKTTAEVQKIVLWANENKISLVPSGGRTGLSGGAVAKNGELVIAFDKMTKVSEVNRLRSTFTCEAGVITEDLQNLVKEKGYYFPVDFASRGSSQIGGNVATNAGGIKVVRYGLMRDWVAGLTVVTGSGEILHLNQALVKNATGYDLRHLFIGSEGTLGFITEIELKVTKPHDHLNVMVVGAPNLESVMNVFAEFRAHTRLMAFELFTDVALQLVLDHFSNLKKPFETPCPIYLLVEFESSNDEEAAKGLECFERCVENGWVIDGVLSQTEAQARDFWSLRENISEASSHYTPYKNDISVTIDRVPDFMKSTDEILKKNYPNFRVVWFGHIGDGNLHINILKPKDLPMNEFVSGCQKVDKDLFTKIQEFSGSISAEHGVGISKKPFLGFTRTESEIKLMKQIKTAFDPNGIMNPGKMI
jgi:FAD/FMN-containing dehydrogenase